MARSTLPPPLFWYGRYRRVTRDVLDTVRDREEIRKHLPDILRDAPPLGHNRAQPGANKRPRKEIP